jgi:nickel transport protein
MTAASAIHPNFLETRRSQNAFMALVLAVLTIAILALPVTARAHSFHVFALGDGNIIEGYAYFGGGARPQHAKLSVENGAGKILLQGETNANGEFRLQVDHLDDYVIRANTGDGHAASYLLKSSELSDALPTATSNAIGTVVALNPVDSASDTATSFSAAPDMVASTTAENTASQHVSITPEQLSQLVSHAVAKQVNPLREQIVAYENKVRFSDIIGGLGIIIGIFGIIAWWQARQKISNTSK